MSKPIIAPRLSIAPSPPVSLVSSPPVTTKGNLLTGTISTSKDWVLPPRPKPGRKPSADAPASKRKAQNRAAQRAFRERRATRVQELEEKLLQVEKEKEIKEMALVNTINKLKHENQYLLKSIDQLKHEMVNSKKNNSHIKGFSVSSLQANSPITTNSVSPASSIYSVQQISPAPSADSPPYDSAKLINNDKDFDCGICLKDHCVCETVSSKVSDLQETIANFKPVGAVHLKKRKADDNEVDFTMKFIKKPLPDFKRLTKKPEVKETSAKFDERSPIDNCGFCSDDTPCVCREAAKEAALLNQNLKQQQITEEQFEDEQTSLPPILLNNVRKDSLPVMHPGPSVQIRDITNLTPTSVPTVVTTTTRNEISVEKSNGGCTGNPGTCAQCQTDPMSTLFCTTVASKARDGKSPDSPDLVSQGEHNNTSTLTPLPTSVSTPGSTPTTVGSDIFIPCADAYKTLSRHKKFNSVDFSTLVGKLTTRGMQVEVQSVANVLRELDRRLYN